MSMECRARAQSKTCQKSSTVLVRYKQPQFNVFTKDNACLKMKSKNRQQFIAHKWSKAKKRIVHNYNTRRSSIWIE